MAFQMLYPRYRGPLTPTAPTAPRLYSSTLKSKKTVLAHTSLYIFCNVTRAWADSPDNDWVERKKNRIARKCIIIKK